MRKKIVNKLAKPSLLGIIFTIIVVFTVFYAIPRFEINPVLKKWIENNIDGPVYVPVKWVPVRSCENVTVFSLVQNDFYQLDFYQSNDESYAGDQVYPLLDAKVNQADFLGSLSRSKNRLIRLKMESTDICTEINLDENVTIFSNEHSTMCYWTINGWDFNYVGPPLTKSEEIKADILKLSSAWDTVEIAEVTDGRIDIVSGNRNTVYYSWKKDGYYWEFALPSINSVTAVTALNSFEKW